MYESLWEGEMDLLGCLEWVGLKTGSMGVDRESSQRDDWNGGHFRCDVETQCKGNSLEYSRVILAKTPKNRGYRA